MVLTFLPLALVYRADCKAKSGSLTSKMPPSGVRDRICSEMRLAATETRVDAAGTLRRGMHHCAGTFAGDSLEPERASTTSLVSISIPTHNLKQTAAPKARL